MSNDNPFKHISIFDNSIQYDCDAFSINVHHREDGNIAYKVDVKCKLINGPGETDIPDLMNQISSISEWIYTVYVGMWNDMVKGRWNRDSIYKDYGNIHKVWERNNDSSLMDEPNMPIKVDIEKDTEDSMDNYFDSDTSKAIKEYVEKKKDTLKANDDHIEKKKSEDDLKCNMNISKSEYKEQISHWTFPDYVSDDNHYTPEGTLKEIDNYIKRNKEIEDAKKKTLSEEKETKSQEQKEKKTYKDNLSLNWDVKDLEKWFPKWNIELSNKMDEYLNQFPCLTEETMDDLIIEYIREKRKTKRIENFTDKDNGIIIARKLFTNKRCNSWIEIGIHHKTSINGHYLWSVIEGDLDDFDINNLSFEIQQWAKSLYE